MSLLSSALLGLPGLSTHAWLELSADTFPVLQVVPFDVATVIGSGISVNTTSNKGLITLNNTGWYIFIGYSTQVFTATTDTYNAEWSNGPSGGGALVAGIQYGTLGSPSSYHSYIKQYTSAGQTIQFKTQSASNAKNLQADYTWGFVGQVL